MDVVFGAPCFDEPTKHSFDFCQEIESYAETHGRTCLKLHKEDCIRERVEEELQRYPDAIWVHYNHGSEDKQWGNDDRPVIDLQNDKLLKHRECYNLNCLSAKELGRDAFLRYGAIYWGYTEVVSFTTDALKEFKEAFNYGLKLRIDTWENPDWVYILTKTKQRMTEIVDELIGVGKIFAAMLLREDRDALVCYTEETPPSPKPSGCWLRRLAVKLFGRKGWRIPNPFD